MPPRSSLTRADVVQIVNAIVDRLHNLPLGLGGLRRIGTDAISAAPGTLATNDFLVKTSSSTLSAERVVTDTSTVTWDWSVAGQAKANASTAGLSVLTTKGDLWGFSTVNARIPVGTNGQVLTADSTQALGVRWAAVPADAVSSVFGRTGAVAAQSGDYTAAQVGALATTLLTTKGDVLGFSTTAARVPVGSNGQVLTADSTNALGVSWQAGGSGTPAVSVTDETTYGIAPAVGSSTNYARQDHTHGSPAAPTAASVGADAAGTSAAGIAAHVGAADPHPQYALESALGTGAALASDTDGTLAANSDARLATQKATKTYADASLSTHVAAGDPHPAYALEAALGSAAALNASTSRAANGIVQLDALGLTAIGAILADERWNVARFVAANNSSDQLGMANPSFAGVAKTPTTKAYVSRESSANAGVFQGTRICDTAVGFAYAIGFKVPVAITPRRIWVGLTSTTQSDSDTASGHYIGLRYSTVAGDAGWTVVSRDGTTQTVGVVGAVPVAGVPYLAVLVKEPGAGTVSLVLHRLDNNTTPLSATVSATLPAGGTAIDFIVLSWGQGTLNAIELSHATRITPLT